MADTRPPELDELETTAQALFESRRFCAQLAIERQHLRDAFDTVRAEERAAARHEMAPLVEAAGQERDRARAERDDCLAERDAAVAARETAFAERDRARAAALEAAAQLERVTSSTAWRLTGPARRLLRLLLGRA